MQDGEAEEVLKVMMQSFLHGNCSDSSCGGHATSIGWLTVQEDFLMDEDA
jgi:hypothetical protein